MQMPFQVLRHLEHGKWGTLGVHKVQAYPKARGRLKGQVPNFQVVPCAAKNYLKQEILGAPFCGGSLQIVGRTPRDIPAPFYTHFLRSFPGHEVHKLLSGVKTGGQSGWPDKLVPKKCLSVSDFHLGPHLNPVTINPVIRMSRLGPLFCPKNSEALSEQFRTESLPPLF